MKKQKYIIKWVISKHRRDKRTGVISPVKPSEYFLELCKKRAGWKNENR